MGNDRLLSTDRLLDDVVRLVAKPPGTCQRIDQRLCVDCAQPRFKGGIEKLVASLGNDQAGDFINVRRIKVRNKLESCVLHHLASEILNGATRDIWRHTIKKGVELDMRGKRYVISQYCDKKKRSV